MTAAAPSAINRDSNKIPISDNVGMEVRVGKNLNVELHSP
jgi:hypothetical protein